MNLRNNPSPVPPVTPSAVTAPVTTTSAATAAAPVTVLTPVTKAHKHHSTTLEEVFNVSSKIALISASTTTMLSPVELFIHIIQSGKKQLPVQPIKAVAETVPTPLSQGSRSGLLSKLNLKFNIFKYGIATQPRESVTNMFENCGERFEENLEELALEELMPKIKKKNKSPSYSSVIEPSALLGAGDAITGSYGNVRRILHNHHTVQHNSGISPPVPKAKTPIDYVKISSAGLGIRTSHCSMSAFFLISTPITAAYISQMGAFTAMTDKERHLAAITFNGIAAGTMGMPLEAIYKAKVTSIHHESFKTSRLYDVTFNLLKKEGIRAFFRAPISAVMMGACGYHAAHFSERLVKHNAMPSIKNGSARLFSKRPDLPTSSRNEENEKAENRFISALP